MSSCRRGPTTTTSASPVIQKLLDKNTRFVAVAGIGLLAPGDTGQLNDGGPSAARTAVAYNRTNDELYVFQGGSYTPDQIQDLFRGLGSDTAVLLDGGGSSAIVLRRDTGGMWAGAGVPTGTATPSRCCATPASAHCPVGWPSTDGHATRCARRLSSAAHSRRRTAPRAPAVDTAGAVRHGRASLRAAAAGLVPVETSAKCGQPNSASIARSVSRCPPCAAGSISTAPSGVHITLPLHRSPCSRAGGSSSSKSPARSARSRRSTASRRRRARRGAPSPSAPTAPGIELAPRRLWRGQRHRQRLRQRAEVARARPAVGSRTERLGARRRG